MVEVLGRLISRKRREGIWRGVKVADGVENLSHLQFVDDTLLRREASFKEARIMKSVLDRYNGVFG